MRETTFGELIHVKHGFPFKSEHFQAAGNLVVLTPGNFFEEGGFKRNSEKDKCYSAEFPPEYILEAGDILVAMTEQAEGLLGSMATVPESDRFLHNQRLGLISAKTPEIHLRFLYHLSKAPWVRKQIRGSSTGSKVKHTSPNRLSDVQVQIPEKAKQEKIAGLLDKIDEKIELNNRINTELEGLAKLIYDYWFVQFDFPMTAEQAAAHGDPALTGKPYKSSGGKMTYNPTLKREIPEGWEDGTIGDLGQIVGGSTPSRKQQEFFTEQGTAWLTPKDLSNNSGRRFIWRGETDLTDAGLASASLRLLPKGSILMSSRAPVGYLAIAAQPVTTNQGFKSIVPAKSFSSEFIIMTLQRNMPLIEANASGSTFREISGKIFASLKIILPDSKVTEKFTEMTKPFFEQQKNLEQQNQELAALRDWLLPMLMNGQVTVGQTSTPALK